MLSVNVAKALANERRLQILGWLQAPRAHFPPQVDGDLVRDGVCGVFIAQKLGVSQPTASEHLKILSQAGLVRARRIKQWTFYKRDEKRIAEVKRAVSLRLVDVVSACASIATPWRRRGAPSDSSPPTPAVFRVRRIWSG